MTSASFLLIATLCHNSPACRFQVAAYAGPSPVVAYRLCGPGKESGEALLKRFKDIRRTLEQGKL